MSQGSSAEEKKLDNLKSINVNDDDVMIKICLTKKK